MMDNPEKYKIIWKKEREAHRERRKLASKIYYHNNCETTKADHRKWNRDNPEKVKEYSRNYYRINIDKLKEKEHRYKTNNLDKMREQNRRRRANKLSAPGNGITAEQEKQLFEEYNYMCAYCGKREPEIELTIDHIESLNCGGADDIENAVSSCQSCNSSKGRKTLLRFLYDRHQKELVVL